MKVMLEVSQSHPSPLNLVPRCCSWMSAPRSVKTLSSSWVLRGKDSSCLLVNINQLSTKLDTGDSGVATPTNAVAHWITAVIE